MSAAIPSLLSVIGTISETPATGSPSGVPDIPIPIGVSLRLPRSGISLNYDLAADGATAVALGQLANPGVNVIFAQVTGGSCDLILTSADGTSQVVPVGPMALLVSTIVPYTAISLARQTGIEVFVQLYLAQGS